MNESEKWRWEFMRRNDEYRADWLRVQKLRGRAEYPPEYRASNGGGFPYIETVECDKERELCKKWGIRGRLFINPDLSYEELVEERVGNPMYLIYSRNERTLAEIPDMGRCVYSEKPHSFFVEISPNPAKNYWTEDNIFHMEIDFSKVNSITELKKQIGEILSLNHRMADKRGVKKSVKINKVDHEDTLRIWDLHTQGMTNVEIAREFYKLSSQADPRSAEKAVCEQLKKAKAMIFDGGYKEITSA